MLKDYDETEMRLSVLQVDGYKIDDEDVILVVVL
jgi:hypothetical protein